MNNVFVFGTLKQGFPNNHINTGEILSGVFETKQKLHLYLVGERHSPWLMEYDNSHPEGEHITGEIYSLDDNGLQMMDGLERVHEPDGYVRQQISLIRQQTLEELQAFVYLKPWIQLDTSLIQSGPLKCYSLEDAAKYSSRK